MEFKLHVGIKNFGDSYNFDNELCNVKQFMEECLWPGTEYFVSVIKPTDDKGVINIDESKIIITDTYMRLSKTLSELEYRLTVAVDVYSFIDNECVSIKVKNFNSPCYESYAGCEPYAYDLPVFVHNLADIGTSIYMM